MKPNLQLFALTPVQTTGLSGLSAENKTFYDKNLIREATPSLVFHQFGQKRPIPKNGGKTIEFRRYAPLSKALRALTEGVTPDGSALSVSAVTGTVAQYGDYIRMSDVLDLTAIDSSVVEATRLLGAQAGRTLDTVVRNVLMGGTNVSYASKWSDGTETPVTLRSDLDTTCLLKVDTVRRAVAKLRSQNAPTIDGFYVGIIHPYAAYDLMKDPEWTDAQKYAGTENLFTGEIGRIAGVRFVQTSEAKVLRDITCPSIPNSGGAGTSIYYGVFCTLILGANAYGVTEVEGGGLQTVVKPLGYGEDPLNQRSSVGWKATKAAVRLVENYMVRVESLSTFSLEVNAN